MKMPYPEQGRCRSVENAMRRATIAELRYCILRMESTATPKAVRKAACRMYEAERDLVRVISNQPDVTHHDSKD